MKFLIVGLPRSGTSWAANLMMANGEICIHDPLAKIYPDELLNMDVGAACTGMWLFPSIINEAKCPTVVIERDLESVNASLYEMGLPTIAPDQAAMLGNVEGYRIKYKDLFNYDKANEMFAYLTGRELCMARHSLMCEMNVQHKECGFDESIMMEMHKWRA